MAGPRHRVDPEGRRLPINLDSTSNGEFLPVPLSRANRRANGLAQEAAGNTADAKKAFKELAVFQLQHARLRAVSQRRRRQSQIARHATVPS